MRSQIRQGWLQRRKRAIALVAVGSVLAQALLAAFAVPAAFAAMRPGATPAGYSQVLICTGSGMKRIVLNADGNRVGQSDDAQGYNCAACHFTGCAALGSPAAPILSLPADFSGFHIVPLFRAGAPDAGFLYPHSRGPPSAVIHL